MYDLANQSFTLLITTLFFGIYFKTVVVGDADGRGEMLWGRSFAIASFIVILTSPVLGALADFSGRKKAFLTGLALGCGVLTMALGLVGPGEVALAMTLYIAANVMFMSGENFLAAFLPEIATRDTIGRVSAIGWTMGYLGAILCLPLALVIPGVREQSETGFRWLFVFAGAWFLVNALPTMLILKERKAPERLPPGQTLLTVGFARLTTTARQIGRYRQLALFLSVFAVYCCGMQVIIVFSGIIASQYLSVAALVGFVFAMAVVSALGSALAGMVQDRIGQRLTVQLSLAVWIVTAVGAAMLPTENASMAHLALVGIGVGLGLGVTGPASRALVGSLTPAHKTAEFFALWGLGYKTGGVVGPLLYGLAHASAGQSMGMLLVGAFFLVGLIGVSFVDVDAGRRAAEEAEREFKDEIDARDLAAAAQMGERELEEVLSQTAGEGTEAQRHEGTEGKKSGD